MIKKSIPFTDYDGNERIEEAYFNLSKPELIEMNFEKDGGLEQYIQKIINTNDMKEMIELMKTLIKKSYGIKSPDGKRMIKTKEDLEAFMQTEAYSNLFMELATDADKANEFIKGIIPSSLADDLNKGKVVAIDAKN